MYYITLEIYILQSVIKYAKLGTFLSVILKPNLNFKNVINVHEKLLTFQNLKYLKKSNDSVLKC